MNAANLFQQSGAKISDCGLYRYRLWRTWDEDKPPLVFVMLNPSTADADKDDPTIRRCMGFARRLGHGGIVVCNLFAYRATAPEVLSTVADPVGPMNDEEIVVACMARRVVAAWGAEPFARKRAADVTRRLKDAGVALYCLGVTKEGCPRHPLYVKGDALLIPLEAQP